MASSTVALATEATLFSVAGSITSKRPPSEDLRHLPPIQRSVGTLARRLSYMALGPVEHLRCLAVWRLTISPMTNVNSFGIAGLRIITYAGTSVRRALRVARRE